MIYSKTTRIEVYYDEDSKMETFNDIDSETYGEDDPWYLLPQDNLPKQTVKTITGGQGRVPVVGGESPHLPQE